MTKSKNYYYPITKSLDKFWKWACTENYYRTVVLKRACKFLKYRENTTKSAVARSILKLVLPLQKYGGNHMFVGRFNFHAWWTDCQMGHVGEHRHSWPIKYFDEMLEKAKYFSIEVYLSKIEEFDDSVIELKIDNLIRKLDPNENYSYIFEFSHSWGDNINWVWRLYFEGLNMNQGKVEIYFD